MKGKVNKTEKKETKTNKKSYTLKPALKIRCMDCNNELIVLFCPPRQGHSNKNN